MAIWDHWKYEGLEMEISERSEAAMNLAEAREKGNWSLYWQTNELY